MQDHGWSVEFYEINTSRDADPPVFCLVAKHCSFSCIGEFVDDILSCQYSAVGKENVMGKYAWAGSLNNSIYKWACDEILHIPYFLPACCKHTLHSIFT
jgi:hypothetical protein